MRITGKQALSLLQIAYDSLQKQHKQKLFKIPFQQREQLVEEIIHQQSKIPVDLEVFPMEVKMESIEHDDQIYM